MIDVNATEEDGWLNPRFERHMIHVLLPTLGTIVRNVDRPETTREQMIKLGKVHKVKVIGLKRKHIEVITLVPLNSYNSGVGFDTNTVFLYLQVTVEPLKLLPNTSRLSLFNLRSQYKMISTHTRSLQSGFEPTKAVFKFKTIS